MKIDQATVINIAKLSKIKLTDSEVTNLTAEFSELFDYFFIIVDFAGKPGDGNQGSRTEKRYIIEKSVKMRVDDRRHAGGRLNADNPDSEIADRILSAFAEKEGRLLVAPKTLL